MISKSKIFLGAEVDKNPLVIDPRRSPDLMSCRIDNPLGALSNDIGIEKRSNVGAGQAIVAIHQLGERFFFLGDSGVGTLPGRLWLTPVVGGWYGWESDSLTFHFFDASEDISGTPTYLWDFGDGTTSSDKNPEHAYSTVDDIPDKVKQVITDGDGTVYENEIEIDITEIGGHATSYPVVDSVTPSEVAPGASASLVIAGSNFPKFKVKHVVIYSASTIIYPKFTVDSGNQITCAYAGNLLVGTYTVGVLLNNWHYGEKVDALEIIILPMEDSYVSSHITLQNKEYGDYPDLAVRVQSQSPSPYVLRTFIKTPQYVNKVLYVYFHNVTQDGIAWRVVGAYDVDPDGWDEDTLNWTKQPAIGSLLNSQTVNAIGWWNWDIGSATSVCLKFIDESFPSWPPTRSVVLIARSKEYGSNIPYVTEA